MLLVGAGMNVGLLLRGMGRDEVAHSQIIATPGSIQPHREGTAECIALAKDEGGRHTAFGVGYKPQFFFGATDVTGTVMFAEGGQVTPGARVRIGFELSKPVVTCVHCLFPRRKGIVL